MRPTLRNFGSAFALTCAVCIAQAAAPETKVLKVGVTSILLTWDSAWQMERPSNAAPPGSARFQMANPHDMTVLLNAVAKPSADADVDAFIKDGIAKAIREFQPLAVEKKLQPRTFSNGGTRGQLVCATDRAPKPEEYKFICRGIATNDEVVLVFGVLYNDAGKLHGERATQALERVQFTGG